MSATVIQAYLDASESMDPERVVALLADDAVLEFPYAVPGMPARVDGGREALLAHSSMLAQFMRSFTYADRTIEPLAQEGRYLVETNVTAVLLDENAPIYENHYVIVATVADGRITHWREFFDTVAVNGLLASMAGAAG